MENGLLDEIRKRYQKEWRVGRHCHLSQVDRDLKTPLSFEDLTSAFIVLGIGVFVSVLTFIFEISINRWRLHTSRMYHGRVYADHMVHM